MAEPLEVQTEEQCTIKNPLGERKTGLLDLSEGVDAALASQNPQRLAQYVLCALSDGDKVAVDVRGKAVARVRVLSSQGCTPGTQGMVLTPMLNCERKKQGKPLKDRLQPAQRREQEVIHSDLDKGAKEALRACDPEAYVQSQHAAALPDEVKALKEFVQKAVPLNNPSRRDIEARFRKIDNEYGVFYREFTRPNQKAAADALGRIVDHYDGIVSLAKRACREKK